MQIAIVTVSDRASRGECEDLSGPLIETWLARAITSPYKLTKRTSPMGLSPFAMSGSISATSIAST